MLMVNKVHLALLALICGTLAGHTPGAAVELPGGKAAYVIRGQDIRDVFGEFGRNNRIEVELTAGVQGRITFDEGELLPQQFLDKLTAAFDLDWFSDGRRLYISATHERTSRALPLAGVSLATLRQTLRDAGALSPRTGLRAGKGGLVEVSGPPRFREMTSQALLALQEGRDPFAAMLAVRPTSAAIFVFRGNQLSVVRPGRSE
jgi:type III secretion protein C